MRDTFKKIEEKIIRDELIYNVTDNRKRERSKLFLTKRFKRLSTIYTCTNTDTIMN